MPPPVPFPRQAYYERINAAKVLLPLLPPQGTKAAAGSPSVSMSFLRHLILAHMTAIPFESVDVILGRLVSLAPKDIYDKLIHARRGGFCYEQNTLFYHALLDAGFTDVRMVAGRVLWGSDDPPHGRSHMLLVVTLPPAEGEAPQPHIVDVGFGVGVPRSPLLLNETAPQHTIAGVLRVRTRDACPGLTGGWTEYVVELQTKERWRPVYHFDLQPLWPRDFYMMNYLTCNESGFMGSLKASRCVGVWVKTKDDDDGAILQAAGDNKAKHAADTTQTGYTYVPRGIYTVMADSASRVAARPAMVAPDVDPASLADVGGLLPEEQAELSSPGDLYNWMMEKLEIDFQQTRLPQYSVSRAEFEKAARERLVIFGGKGFTRPSFFSSV